MTSSVYSRCSLAVLRMLNYKICGIAVGSCEAAPAEIWSPFGPNSRYPKVLQATRIHIATTVPELGLHTFSHPSTIINGEAALRHLIVRFFCILRPADRYSLQYILSISLNTARSNSKSSRQTLCWVKLITAHLVKVDVERFMI
jgi:hypothetical protein